MLQYPLNLMLNYSMKEIFTSALVAATKRIKSVFGGRHL